MKLLRQIWDDIRRGENIDLYVAVPLAIGIAVISVMGVTSAKDLIAPITLVILSLLATSLVGNRHALKELSQKLTETADTFFLKDLPATFETDFERATELWIVGVSLTTIIRIHYSLIERKLRNGHVVKALLVHPEGAAVEMAEMRAYGHSTVERARNEVLNSLQDLCHLREVAPDKLEIRTIQNPLSHGIIAVDPENASGTIYIQTYPFRTEGGSRPKFVLRAKDGYWYDFFKMELRNLWDNGTEWQCSRNR